MSEVKRFVIFVSVMWVIGLSIGALILIKHFNEGIKTAEAVAYKQGYKDALYKRPVSNDLEMVCAGLWVGQENLKYQQQEMQK
jgi:hypothetical protein